MLLHRFTFNKLLSRDGVYTEYVELQRFNKKINFDNKKNLDKFCYNYVLDFSYCILRHSYLQIILFVENLHQHVE